MRPCGRVPHGQGKQIRRMPEATKLVVEQPLYILRLSGRGRRLVGLMSMTTLPHHQTRGRVAISATFSVNGRRRTLEPESSGEEKRAVSLTGARDPLSICMRQGIQRTYRMR